VDWEVELGVVIGRRARRVSQADALAHVGGYTIVNDVSARDLQTSDGQWMRAKSFDTFTPMGPWITTTDELGDASGLGIRLWVNGQLKQSGNTSDLVFGVAALVSYCSQAFTLEPGDVISSGTPSGVGNARKPPEYLHEGDALVLEIDGIGRLHNTVRRDAP
jgi:2-keto-4-pentenoate hydratase/2-oxohepta-3-ene-1,7-dioic acid hydratase in catechol pathway